MDLQVFENEEFGTIRTVEKDGKILFCGSDVAKALGYARPNDAISAYCRATVKHSTLINEVAFHDLTDNLGRIQQMKFINEGVVKHDRVFLTK